MRIGGGVSTIRQYLVAGAVDEMHLAISPVLIGEAEPLFATINLHQLGFKVVRRIEGQGATHVKIQRA